MNTNINNYNFNKLDLKLSDYKYWDFYLHPWEDSTKTNINECKVISYDFNDPNIFLNNGEIISSSVWEGAINDGLTLNNIGLTGMDNGLINPNINPNDPTNQNIINSFTGSTFNINGDFKNLILTPVTGFTEDLDYTLEVNNDNTGNIVKLCGGFYQGFYKIDGKDYHVIPDRFEKGWALEYWIKKEDCINTGNTLNKLYPNNKGLFFYMGSRAENKFWSHFDGLNVGENSGCTVDNNSTPLCTPIKESEIFLKNNLNNIITLNPPNITYNEIDNKFLTFHRGEDGLTTNKNLDDTPLNVSGFSETITNSDNKFLTFHRGEGGLMGCNYSGDTSPITELDYEVDLLNNGLGFIVTDDCRIGYKSIIKTEDVDCVTGITINESYSEPNIIPNNEWVHIVIRNVFDNTVISEELSKTNEPRNGKLLFYINGKLKHVEENVVELIPKKLNDDSIKQEGVPFNISIGGGTQGLLESITLDGKDPKDKDLFMVSNYGGTFEGCISQFNFYNCNINYGDVTDLYENSKDRYNIS